MVRIKTAELTGPELDWAVATIEGWQTLDMPAAQIWMRHRNLNERCHPIDSPLYYLRYSSDWKRGGPLIEKHNINTIRCNELYFPKGNEHGDFYEPYWKATLDGGTDAGIPLYKTYGHTPLIAAMRCLVSSKLGDFIDVPEALKEMM